MDEIVRWLPSLLTVGALIWHASTIAAKLTEIIRRVTHLEARHDAAAAQATEQALLKQRLEALERRAEAQDHRIAALEERLSREVTGKHGPLDPGPGSRR